MLIFHVLNPHMKSHFKMTATQILCSCFNFFCSLLFIIYFIIIIIITIIISLFNADKTVKILLNEKYLHGSNNIRISYAD